MLITVIVFCEELEQMNNNVDHTLIIGVLSKLLPFLVDDKGEKSYGDRETYGDREKLTDTKEKWRETRAVYFLSGNRFVWKNDAVKYCILAGRGGFERTVQLQYCTGYRGLKDWMPDFRFENLAGKDIFINPKFSLKFQKIYFIL